MTIARVRDLEPSFAPRPPACAGSPFIPKRLHYTDADPELGPQVRANLEVARRLNPGWQCVSYDEAAVEALILEAYGAQMHARYRRIDSGCFAARADLFRYLVIYARGGATLDAGAKLSRRLDDVILPTDRFLVQQWDNAADGRHPGRGLHPELRHVPGGEFQRGLIFAPARHPLMKAVIDHVCRNLDRSAADLAGGGELAISRTTGAIAYTLALAPLLHTQAHRWAQSASDLGFSYGVDAPDPPTPSCVSAE